VDSHEAQEISDRDQLWASLRDLRPEIGRLATGNRQDSLLHDQLIVLLARIVLAELGFREKDAEDSGPAP
jgi:hypothetical protein